MLDQYPAFNSTALNASSHRDQKPLHSSWTPLCLTPASHVLANPDGSARKIYPTAHGVGPLVCYHRAGTDLTWGSRERPGWSPASLSFPTRGPTALPCESHSFPSHLEKRRMLTVALSPMPPTCDWPQYFLHPIASCLPGPLQPASTSGPSQLLSPLLGRSSPRSPHGWGCSHLKAQLGWALSHGWCLMPAISWESS